MARIRTQLAIQVPPAFLARLKAEATAQGRSVTSLAMQWLEAGLAGASTPAPAPRRHYWPLVQLNLKRPQPAGGRLIQVDVDPGQVK